MVCSSPFKREKHGNQTRISDKKERKKMASCAGKNMFSSMSSYGWIPFYFLSSIILLILTLFLFGPWSKKDSNWLAIGLQSLSILQLCPCKLGKKKIPSGGKNLSFHTRYSNRNILSLWYRNQVILVYLSHFFFLHFWILQHVCKTPKGIGQYSKK
jgi:hypothetical protein